jgi:hypothetical protein
MDTARCSRSGQQSATVSSMWSSHRSAGAVIGMAPWSSAWSMYYADPFDMPIVDGEVLHLLRS